MTNFSRIEVESRPFARGGRVPSQGGASGTDRARRVGTGAGRTHWETREGTVPAPQTTHSRPLQGLPGPAPLSVVLLPRARWLGSTRYTHPGYPPVYPSQAGTQAPVRRAVPHVPRCRGVTGTCTYGCFDTTVGEPRGIEYTPVSGSRTRSEPHDWFTRPFDWFIPLFY